ncbi:MAG: DUF4114 domain-containing protein [Planctomycetota bacterium]
MIRFHVAAALAIVAGWGTVGSAGPNDIQAAQAPMQAPVRPFGLPVVGPVYQNASDARSQEFADDLLAKALALVEVNLNESTEYVARNVTRLDTDKLYLMHNTIRTVRVYFLNEGAGYRNSLGVSASLAGSTEEGQRELLFPDVSDGTFGGPVYLGPGDWVDLGHFGAGTQLEFFIIRDGARGGRDVFTNKDHRNPDKLQHMVAWLLGDRFVLVGFEDLMGGGDLDYNDVVFVVDLQDGMTDNPSSFLPK